jgi:hypothetical protein
MHDYLTEHGLIAIAQGYRQQAETAESFTGIRRAEGAALAIEHLIRECYPQDSRSNGAKPKEKVSAQADKASS